MKPKHIIISCIIVALLATFWVWRYTTLNSYYESLSDRERQVFQLGEEVPFGEDWINSGIAANGYLIRVDGFEILDYDSYVSSLDVEYPIQNSKPDKLALVYITLRNENSTADGVMLTELKLHGIDNYVGMNWDLLLIANPVLAGNYGIRLSPGTEYRVVLPFDLQEGFFGADTWNNITQYKFYLHVTAFPTEKDILVQ